MLLQESQHHRTRARKSQSRLSLALKAFNGECRLATVDSVDSTNSSTQQTISLTGGEFKITIPAGATPADALELKNAVEQLLEATTLLETASSELAIRDNTLSLIDDVMESYSHHQNPRIEFIEALGPQTKYALIHHDLVIANEAFTQQAIQAGLAHLEHNSSHSIRVLDGELFCFGYPPYSLLVETIQRIPDPIKHLLQLYIREMGHQERTDRARLVEKKVDQMEWLSNHDPLTGLANRRLLTQVANSLLAKDHIETDCHANLHVDLDGFKAVNDIHGHQTGDDLLKHVADLLRTECNSESLIARAGGDEFVIICSHIKNEEEIINLAGRIVEAVAIPTILNGNRCQIGASIGISWWRPNNNGIKKSVNTWMKEADDAMYESKRNGKSSYRVA